MHGRIFKHGAARTVDQHVELAELGYGSIDGLFDGGFLRDIGLNEYDFAAGVFDFLLGAFSGFGDRKSTRLNSSHRP